MSAELDALRAHLQATPDGHYREVLAKAVARIEELEAVVAFRETQLALREMKESHDAAMLAKLDRWWVTGTLTND